MSKKQNKIIDLPDKEQRPYNQPTGQSSPRSLAAAMLKDARHQCLKPNDTSDSGNPEVRALDDLTDLLESLLAANTPADDEHLEEELNALSKADQRRSKIAGGQKKINPKKTIRLNKYQ